MHHQNSAVVDLCPSSQEVFLYVRADRFKNCGAGMSKPTSQLSFCPIFDENSKNTWICIVLFLSSSIASWVWAEWTMCLNLLMKTIKVKNLFCLPEWSILIGRYAATGVQYFNLAMSHVNKQVLLWCWSKSFVQHIYWFLNILIKQGWFFEPVQFGNW